MYLYVLSWEYTSDMYSLCVYVCKGWDKIDWVLALRLSLSTVLRSKSELGMKRDVSWKGSVV
jgi:hypothetical protein